MTIYDALSQEYGLSIYHDYLLDNNQEQLAEMCLSNINELEQLQSSLLAKTGSCRGLWAYSRSWTSSPIGSRSRSSSGSGVLSYPLSRSISESGNY